MRKLQLVWTKGKASVYLGAREVMEDTGVIERPTCGKPTLNIFRNRLQ